MTDLTSQSRPNVRRGWLVLAIVGCLLAALAMIVVALVIIDKPHFGSLVGPAFLPVITSGLFVGAIMLAIATWNLPVRRNWRGIVLFAWALVALTSPLFGLMFLLPWGALALTLPVVVGILFNLYRTMRLDVA